MLVEFGVLEFRGLDRNWEVRGPQDLGFRVQIKGKRLEIREFQASQGAQLP